MTGKTIEANKNPTLSTLSPYAHQSTLSLVYIDWAGIDYFLQSNVEIDSAIPMHAHMLITKCKKNKKDDSRSSQLVSGDPINPSGQVHSARWLITRQMAYLPHGFSSAHGLIHLVSRQAV